MKYKVGDKVKIKSIDWWDNNNINGRIKCNDWYFISGMDKFCGKIVTITEVYPVSECYNISEDDNLWSWTDEMIEGLVGEEILIEKVDDRGVPFNEWLSHKGAFYIPEGYVLKDDNGNEILTNKIILEKIKKEYPKTYEECAKVLLDRASVRNDFGYKGELLVVLQKLLVCRDAYWKIYGEEMGLVKSWDPDWENKEEEKYTIEYFAGMVYKDHSSSCSRPFAFPTAEMRDTFYENFKTEIEECKELL